MFVDSHIHLTHSLYEGEIPCIVSSDNQDRIQYMNRDQMIDAFAKNGMGFCVEPGIEFESNYRILELANNYPDFIYPAVGLHPTKVSQIKWSKRKELDSLTNHHNVVAVGELGMDYHYARWEQHRIKQKIWFIWQLKLAYRKKLPLILHIRLADDDAVKILRRYKKKIHGGVCHCFNRGPDIADIYTKEFGFMLGIGGSLLKNNCSQLERAIIKTPLEYLLLETDGPYIKPVKPENITEKQWKKSRNTSLIIPDIAKRVAELKGIKCSEVEMITAQNAARLFGIKDRVKTVSRN